MRQAQQNRRGRGRNNNNNNRKGQNPLTRSFESNGPDVKIRGTPSHIAEKYVAMARDALSSGDPVLAENYLQHAEHYNRIIMTYREQQSGQPEGNQNGHHAQNDGRADNRHNDRHNEHRRRRNAGDPVEFDDDDDGGELPRGNEAQPRIVSDDDRPQRRLRGRDRDHRDREGRDREPRDRDRGDTRDREPRERELRDREPRESRDRDPRDRDRGDAEGDKLSGSGRGNGRGRRTRYAQSDDQPDFLKRPVKRPRSRDDDPDDVREPETVSGDQTID